MTRRHARQFAVRCVADQVPPLARTASRPSGDDRVVAITERLTEELAAGGLEEVVIAPDARGEALIIKGLASAESREGARALVEELIHDATVDLTMLEPGVWVDSGIRG